MNTRRDFARVMLKAVTLAVLGCACAIGATPARAAVIYDNQAAVTSGHASDPAFPLFVADDFVLMPGASTVTGIRWTGMYALFNTPLSTDLFTIQIYGDGGGAPTVNPLHTFAVGNSVNRIDTGIDRGPYDLYAYSAEIARSR